VTRYQLLATSVHDLLRRTDQFYINATTFLEKFPLVIGDFLEAPAGSIRLRCKGDGPPHTWPLFYKPRLGSDDTDAEHYVTFAVTISVDSFGVTFTPVFTFKPIVNGFEVLILKRKPDGLLDRAERFEITDIQNSNAWQPLLDKSLELWQENCAFDPFSPRRESIGFDVSPRSD
jgi:hypothetical protein